MPSKQHETTTPLPSPSASRKTEPRAKRSPAQMAASRADSKRSTGPRTKAGKQSSRRNSWKHGCYSNEFTANLLLTYSTIEEEGMVVFANHLRCTRSNFQRQCRPCAPEEALLVDRMAWLWHRLFCIQFSSQRPLHSMKEPRQELLDTFPQTEDLAPLEGRLERSISKLRKDLAFLQRMRLGRDPQWGIQDVEPLIDEEDGAESGGEKWMVAESDATAADPTDEGAVTIEPTEPSADGGDGLPSTRSESEAEASETETRIATHDAVFGADKNTEAGSERYNENEGTNPNRENGD